MEKYTFEEIWNAKEPKKPVKNSVLHNTGKLFCKCEKPVYNYPEMVWCDNCRLEITNVNK